MGLLYIGKVSNAANFASILYLHNFPAVIISALTLRSRVSPTIDD